MAEYFSAKADEEAFRDAAQHYVRRFQLNLKSPLYGTPYLEVENYIKTTSCKMNNKAAVSVNPTFLQPATGKWMVKQYACPFKGYLPLPVKELEEMKDQNGAILDYCKGVLKKRLMAFQQRIKDVKFYFYPCDAMVFCYEESPLKFDLIDTSTLSDEVGLVNLLNAATRKLRCQQSILFTESPMWHERHFTAEEYVQKMLFCSPSLIPTVYGLRLKDNIHLGSEIPPSPYGDYGSVPPCRLCWMKALPFEGVPLVLTRPLEKSLERLKAACFLLPPNLSGRRELCGISRNTPLTFANVVNDLIQRGGIQGSSAIMSKLFSAPAPVFRTALETTKAWMENRPVWRVTMDIQITSIHGICRATRQIPILRLVLVPTSLVPKMRSNKEFLKRVLLDLDSTDNHVIDNFELIGKRKPSGGYEMDRAELSFLLQDGTLLSKKLSVIVFDLEIFLPVCSGKDIGSLKQTMELFSRPYPCSTLPRLPVAPGSSAKPSRLIAESCKESEEGYTIRLKVHSSDPSSNLTLKGIDR